MHGNSHLTPGITEFGQCGSDGAHLFQINANVPVIDALAYSSNLQRCVNQLMLDTALGESGEHAKWAAIYLGEMAKAIVDDLAAATRAD